MKVTPLDIRRKEFKRSVRGYADEEVDLFLDEVADEIERLNQESTELLERLRRQEEQLAGSQLLREALEKTLVSAQLQADETRANARKEADAMLRDAELKAQGIVGESYGEVQKVQLALVQLKHLEEDFRFKFQSLLEGHLKLLAEPPIGLAAAEAVAVEAPPVMTAPAPMPAAAPELKTPFVVPTAFEEVPEYPPVAVPRVETPAEPVATAAAEPQPVVASPVVEDKTVLQPPASLLWAGEPAVGAGDETATAEHGNIPGAEYGEDVTRILGGFPAGNDDSATFAGDDPLKSFFFAPKVDAEDVPKGGKSRPRDFEW